MSLLDKFSPCQFFALGKHNPKEREARRVPEILFVEPPWVWSSRKPLRKRSAATRRKSKAFEIVIPGVVKRDKNNPEVVNRFSDVFNQLTRDQGMDIDVSITILGRAVEGMFQFKSVVGFLI